DDYMLTGAFVTRRKPLAVAVQQFGALLGRQAPVGGAADDVGGSDPALFHPGEGLWDPNRLPRHLLLSRDRLKTVAGMEAAQQFGFCVPNLWAFAASVASPLVVPQLLARDASRPLNASLPWQEYTERRDLLDEFVILLDR